MKNIIIKAISICVMALFPFIGQAANGEVPTVPLSLDNILLLILTVSIALVALCSVYAAYRGFDAMVKTREMELYKRHNLQDYM